MELFSQYGVFSHREMHSRYEIALEQYALSIGVEARSTLEIGTTVVLPAALRYQTELAQNIAALQAVGIEPDRRPLDDCHVVDQRAARRPGNARCGAAARRRIRGARAGAARARRRCSRR